MIKRILLALALLSGSAQAASTPWLGAYVWGNEYKAATGGKPGLGQFYQTVAAQIAAGIDTIRINVAPTSLNGLIRYGLVTQGVIGITGCSGGTGWTTAPVMTFSAPFPGGRVAKAHAIVSGGVVTSCVIDDGGDYDTALNYGNTPIISVTGPGSGFAPTVSNFNLGLTQDTCTHTGATCFVQYLTAMLAGNVWDNPHLKRIIINMQDSTVSSLGSNPWVAATLTANASAIQAEFVAAYQAIYNRFGPNTTLQFISDNWEGDNAVFGSSYTFQQGGVTSATATITNNVMNVTTCTTCTTPFVVGAAIGGIGIPYPTTISSFAGGSGTTGGYNLATNTGVPLNVASGTVLYPYQAQATQLTWPSGQTNQQRAAAFTQWVGYKDAALATFHATYPGYPIYISEEINALHAWDGTAGTAQAVSSMSWASTAGGQLTVVMAAASPILLGENVTVYGATNTGTGGANVLNASFIVNTWTDSQHFTLAAPASAGVYGTIGGTITAGLAAYGCRGACNGAPGNASTFSPDNLYASIVAAGGRTGPYQMCSESDYESFGNNTLVTDANLIMNGACPQFYIGEFGLDRTQAGTHSNTDILHYYQQAPFASYNQGAVTSAPQVIGYTPWNAGEGDDISQQCGWFNPQGAQDVMPLVPAALRPKPHNDAAYWR